MSEFKYQEPFPLGEDTTEYRLLTKDYVKVETCGDRKILRIDPAGLELLSREAYADVSFSGCAEEFYAELLNYMKEQDEKTRSLMLSRILFGSDFSVNLLKVESYTEYYSILENSPLSDEEITRFASINPVEFLGLKENGGKLPG